MTTIIAGYATVKPSSAPTAAMGSGVGGLTAGVYNYKITYVTAFGETDGSSAGAITTSSATSSVSLTAIPVSTNTNVIQRKIYRTAVNNSTTYSYVDVLTDNTTTTYTDTKADGALGSTLPTLNSAHSRGLFNGIVKMSSPTLYSLESGITAFATGGQTSATQLSSEYNIVATVATAADSVKLPILSSDLIGLRVVVANDGANSTNVFPSLGQDASAGTNTAVAVAAAARAEFVAKSATAWEKVR